MAQAEPRAAEPGPYHEGEVAVQVRVGERDAAIRNGRIIADAVPPAAVPFVAAQRLAVLAAADPDEAIWCAVVGGPPGFASVSEDRRTVRLAWGAPAPTLAPTGPLAALREGDPVGLLFAELATRRRLRVNGALTVRAGTSLTIGVEEAYPNCPKYIQRRVPEDEGAPTPNHEIARGDGPGPEPEAWIARADTLFVASRGPAGRLDASHRGGAAGFVRLEGNRLLIPDYPGNSMFNTFGNLALDPRAGLAIPDFEGGRQLCLTGEAELHLDGDRDPPPSPTGGTGRWWSFAPHRWTTLPLGTLARWRLVDASPFNPPARAAQ